jgi:hypothetical protein
MGKERSSLCLCTCKAQCQILDPTTGRYDGRWIPRTTRDVHVRDEKNRRRQRQLQHLHTLDPSAVTLPIRAVNQDDESISHFQDEFLFLSHSPITSLKNPLVFTNNPLTNGEFVAPEFPEILEPNSGIYALRSDLRVNQAFIMTENRCCNIFTSLRTMKSSKDSRDALMQALVDHLVFLNYQKSLQWAQFRGGQSPGGLTRTSNDGAKSPLIVNSGNYLFSYFPLASNAIHFRTLFLHNGDDAHCKGGICAFSCSSKLLFFTPKGTSFTTEWYPRHHSPHQYQFYFAGPLRHPVHS